MQAVNNIMDYLFTLSNHIDLASAENRHRPSCSVFWTPQHFSQHFDLYIPLLQRRNPPYISTLKSSTEQTRHYHFFIPFWYWDTALRRDPPYITDLDAFHRSETDIPSTLSNFYTHIQRSNATDRHPMVGRSFWLYEYICGLYRIHITPNTRLFLNRQIFMYITAVWKREEKRQTLRAAVEYWDVYIYSRRNRENMIVI